MVAWAVFKGEDVWNGLRQDKDQRDNAASVPTYSILRHGGSVKTLAYSFDSKYIAAGTVGGPTTAVADQWIGEIRIYNVSLEKEIRYVKLDQWIAGIAFHPAGDKVMVASSSYNNSRIDGFQGFKQQLGEITIFEFPSMKKICSTSVDTVIHDADYSSDGKYISLTRSKEKLHHRECVILDGENLQEKLVISDPMLTCGLGLVNRENDLVFVAMEHIPSRAGKGRTAKIRLTDGAEMGEFAPGSSGFNRMRLTRNVDELEIYSKNGIFFYDLKNQKYHYPQLNTKNDIRIKNREPGTASCLSQDRKFAVVAAKSSKANVYLYDGIRGECIRVFESQQHHGKPHFPVCAFAPDGKTFAVGAHGFKHVGEFSHGHVLLFKMPRQE